LRLLGCLGGIDLRLVEHDGSVGLELSHDDLGVRGKCEVCCLFSQSLKIPENSSSNVNMSRWYDQVSAVIPKQIRVVCEGLEELLGFRCKSSLQHAHSKSRRRFLLLEQSKLSSSDSVTT
jgi:hypothetical protein